MTINNGGVRTGLLKRFLATENKSITDVVMSPDHTLGLVKMDSASCKWLETQGGIKKLDMAGIIGIRTKFSPWLFNQVVFMFLGIGFGDVEEHMTAYYMDDEPIFFTIGYSGFYVFLAPIQDLTQDNKEVR